MMLICFILLSYLLQTTAAARKRSGRAPAAADGQQGERPPECKQQ
nr:nucleosome assembly protein 1;2 isoform X1 [Ipomoea batatas]